MKFQEEKQDTLSVYAYHLGIITGYEKQNKPKDDQYKKSFEIINKLKNKIPKSKLIEFTLRSSEIIHNMNLQK